MADLDAWSVNANDAITVSIVKPSSQETQASSSSSSATKTTANVVEFHPQFTYPIFGESETIFGYQNLHISLTFAGHDLRPHVDVKYDRKFKTVGDTAALDVVATLKEYLPPIAFDHTTTTTTTSPSATSTTTDDWTPPGERVHTYQRGKDEFEIWAAPLSDPAMKTVIDNIQILVLFFIEGAVYINLDDPDWTLDRWRIYLLYRKGKGKGQNQNKNQQKEYSFVGYATTYRFYHFITSAEQQQRQPQQKKKEIDPTVQDKNLWKSLPSRLRISQFLILPSYQRGGHGSALYQTIQREALADPTITELTVEDPSEEFDKLRDVNDFYLLRPRFDKAQNPPVEFNPATLDELSKLDRAKLHSLRVPTARLLPLDSLAQIRKDLKIAPRQFARLTEMYLLAKIKFSRRSQQSTTSLTVKGARSTDPDDRMYYWWRALLKQRILRKNHDQLVQLPADQRISLIEDAARGQQDEYEGMLLVYALQEEKEKQRQQQKQHSNQSHRHHGGSGDGDGKSAKRKRNIIDDGDDDDHGDDADDGSRSERSLAKTPRLQED